MLTVCYAAKGGSGTTVLAAVLALSSGPDSLLVDLDGDVPGLFATPAHSSPGISDWLNADVDPAAVADLGHPVTDHLTVVPRGGADHAAADPTRWEVLARWLAVRPGPAVVDAGTGEPPTALADAADALLLVTRPCYLSLARALRSPTRPTGVVLVDESGRALGRRDVANALGVPIVARVTLDPKVARAVDAGLLAASAPRGLGRHLRGAAA